VTIQNSTIAENSAGTSGGGVYRNSPAAVTLTAKAQRARTGTQQQPVSGPRNVTISSSIVGDNTAADLGEGGSGGGSFIVGFSLIENADSATVTESPAGSNITGQDAQLGALQNNGGPTQTQAPADASPAIDAGVANGLSVDQRNLPRTVDRPKPNAPGSDGTDMGAVELGAIPPIPAACPSSNANEIIGTNGNETLRGTAQPDAILTLGGNDTAVGLTANDCVFGQGGKDTLRGNAGNDLVAGGPGNDVLVSGNGGNDKVTGGGGDDRVRGGPGTDKVIGNAGDDNVKGKGGNDKVKGNGGDDVVKGNVGNDKLKGGPGNDKILGGDGNDVIVGGPGADKINCGTGHDVVKDASPADHINKNCEVQ
jgi:Ca2+-binding RTX toxin-like protein